MADNESGAKRPDEKKGPQTVRHTPPPTQAQRGAAPPPPPGARKLTGMMPAVSSAREGSFSGPKPAPEQPKKANTLRAALGENVYIKMVATLVKLCSACGLDKGQFMADGNSLLFRNPSTSKDSRMPVEFVGGKPEIRIYFDAIGIDSEKDARCKDILREFGAGSIGDPRTRLLSSMNYVYIRVTEERISLCGSGKREGQPLVYLFLNVQ